MAQRLGIAQQQIAAVAQRKVQQRERAPLGLYLEVDEQIPAGRNIDVRKRRIAQQILRSVSSVRGAADPQMEITSGVADLSIAVDRAALARYGLNVTDVEEAVSSGGSGDVMAMVDNNRGERDGRNV